MQNNSAAELEIRRELAVVRYVDAVDRGDLDALTPILSEAEADPELDRRIAEVNTALHLETGLGSVRERSGGVLSLLGHMLLPNVQENETMTTVSLLREQILSTREYLEATMADVTTDQASWSAGGRTLPIDAQYAHVVFSMDAGLHGLLQGSAPLAATSLAGKTGFTSLPPFNPGATWEEWAQGPFDLGALREYASSVYAATDDYLSELTPEDLGRDLDLTALGLGVRTVGWMLTTGWVVNPNMHCGEISCLKGLQGMRGYPT